MKECRRWYNGCVIVGILVVGGLVGILKERVVIGGMGDMMEELNIDVSKGEWVTRAFMVRKGILIGMRGLLMEKF